jgi:hypothetical protein
VHLNNRNPVRSNTSATGLLTEPAKAARDAPETFRPAETMNLLCPLAQKMLSLAARGIDILKAQTINNKTRLYF